MESVLVKSLASFIFSSLILTGLALAQSAPNPNQVHIQRITYAGPGCRQGTVTGNIAFDAKAFTLVFNDFIAEIGPGVPGGERATNCRVTLDIRIPNGWTYTLFDVDYRGFAFLEEGVSANLRSKYFFQASPNSFVQRSKSFEGYLSDNFSERNTLGIESLEWSRCGRQRALNIETEISLQNSSYPENYGLITVDSIDGQFTQVFGIRWARC